VVAPAAGHNDETERSASRPSCCPEDAYPNQRESPQDYDTEKSLSHCRHPAFFSELTQIVRLFEWPDENEKVYGIGRNLSFYKAMPYKGYASPAPRLLFDYLRHLEDDGNARSESLANCYGLPEPQGWERRDHVRAHIV